MHQEVLLRPKRTSSPPSSSSWPGTGPCQKGHQASEPEAPAARSEPRSVADPSARRSASDAAALSGAATGASPGLARGLRLAPSARGSPRVAAPLIGTATAGESSLAPSARRSTGPTPAEAQKPEISTGTTSFRSAETRGPPSRTRRQRAVTRPKAGVAARSGARAAAGGARARHANRPTWSPVVRASVSRRRASQ